MCWRSCLTCAILVWKDMVVNCTKRPLDFWLHRRPWCQLFLKGDAEVTANMPGWWVVPKSLQLRVTTPLSSQTLLWRPSWLSMTSSRHWLNVTALLSWIMRSWQQSLRLSMTMVRTPLTQMVRFLGLGQSLTHNMIFIGLTHHRSKNLWNRTMKHFLHRLLTSMHAGISCPVASLAPLWDTVRCLYVFIWLKNIT